MKRAKDDVLNTYLAGAISGAFFGGIPRIKKGFGRIIIIYLLAFINGALTGSLSFALFSLLFTEGLDYLKEMKRKKEH